MKTCNKCGEEKEDEKFSPNPRMKDGRNNTCSRCRGQKQMERYREDPEFRRRISEYKSKCWLKKKYGMTPEQFNEMFEKQGRVCALCRTDEHGRGGVHKESRWNVDHDHETGKIRGILCHHCNVSLGHFERLVKEVGKQTILKYLK
jgi:hypothetical protein